MSGHRVLGRRAPLALALSAVTALLAILPRPAEAAAGTQQVTAKVGAGSLTLNEPPAVSLGPTVPGGTAAASLGTVSWTDTLNDGTVSNVLLSATDFYDASTGAHIGFTNMSITVGQSITGVTGNAGAAPSPAAPGPFALGGPDWTPGLTYSAPISLATGSATTEGTWTQSGNRVTLIVPASSGNGTYVATFQYTITG